MYNAMEVDRLVG